MLAELLAGGLIVYGVAGFAFACGFVMRGAERLDSTAAKSGAAFRLIILPGSAALWPFLLRRWLHARGGES